MPQTWIKFDFDEQVLVLFAQQSNPLTPQIFTFKMMENKDEQQSRKLEHAMFDFCLINYLKLQT